MAVAGVLSENDVQDEPLSKKRSNFVNQYILDNFNLITRDEKSQRAQGCLKLLSSLARESQEKVYEVQYAFKRTIRGLGSKQQNTRLGFYPTLVCLLENHSDVTVNEVLNLVQKELHVNKNVKSETGDIYMGHILTCGALLRSGSYAKTSDENKRKIIEMLIVASRQKVYLALAAYSFMLDFIGQIEEEEFQSSLWPQLKREFAKPLTSYNLDSLYFILKLSILFPNSMKKFLKRNFGVAKVIHEDTIHVLADKLMAIPDIRSLDHPIYELVGNEIAKMEYLSIFWTSGIDSHLNVANRNRELVAINLAITIVKSLKGNSDSTNVSCLITENFLTRILDRFKTVQLSGKTKKRKFDTGDEDRKLVISKAKEFFENFGSMLTSETINDDLKLDVLNKLMFYPGDILFPQITTTSVTRTIIASLTANGVKKFAECFKKVLFCESKKRFVGGAERLWVNAERLHAAEVLSYLVAHPTVADEASWRSEYLKYFLQFSIFRTLDEQSSEVSPTLAAAVKNCLFRSLNSKVAKLEVRINILENLAKYIDSRLENPDAVSRIERSFPEESQISWKSMRKFTLKLEKVSRENFTKEHKVFLILSLQLGLFLFSEPKNIELARSSLQELQNCYDHLKKRNREADEIDSEVESDQPQWIEVLIEVFLSILSHDCNLLRSLIASVFHYLCESLTQSALLQIVSVLDPESNPLSKNRDEQSESGDAMSDDGISSDKEEDGEILERSENGTNAALEEASDSDIDMSEEEEEELKVSDQFRLEVRKALGDAAPDTDTESVDADLIEEEDGKRIDQALSQAFKLLRKSKHKKSKGERKDDIALIHFRIRILDLIDVYSEKALSMNNCLTLLTPLINCLEFTLKDTVQKPLEVRLRKSIRIITNLKSFQENDVEIKKLAEYLKSIIDKGSRSQFVYQAIGDKIAECSKFGARCTQNIVKGMETLTPKKQDKLHRPLVEVFAESLNSFFKNRNCLLPIIMFHHIFNLEWDGNWALLPIIVENVFDVNTRQFRKYEGLQLLRTFYNTFNRGKVSICEQKFANFESILSKHILESLDDDHFLETYKKEHFFKLLFELLSCIKALHRSTSKTDGHLEWDRIKNAISNAGSKITIKKLKQKFNALFNGK